MTRRLLTMSIIAVFSAGVMGTSSPSPEPPPPPDYPPALPVDVPQLPPRAERAAAPAGPQAQQWRAEDADLAARFLQGLAPAVFSGGPRLA